LGSKGDKRLHSQLHLRPPAHAVVRAHDMAFLLKFLPAVQCGAWAASPARARACAGGQLPELSDRGAAAPCPLARLCAVVLALLCVNASVLRPKGGVRR
jgi:hypothetical protein